MTRLNFVINSALANYICLESVNVVLIQDSKTIGHSTKFLPMPQIFRWVRALKFYEVSEHVINDRMQLAMLVLVSQFHRVRDPRFCIPSIYWECRTGFTRK